MDDMTELSFTSSQQKFLPVCVTCAEQWDMNYKARCLDTYRQKLQGDFVAADRTNCAHNWYDMNHIKNNDFTVWEVCACCDADNDNTYMSENTSAGDL